MAQNTPKYPEVQWWGLPVGLTFIVAGVALTMWVNRGINDATTAVVGAFALPLLGLGILGLGAFIYSVIVRSAAPGEQKYANPTAHH